MTHGKNGESLTWSRWYLLRIACSVRPGSMGAIVPHLCPICETEETMIASSAGVQLARSGALPCASDGDLFTLGGGRGG